MERNRRRYDSCISKVRGEYIRISMFTYATDDQAEEHINKLKDKLEKEKSRLESLVKKLSNKLFVDRAPKDIVEKEFEKKIRCEKIIECLEYDIEQTSKNHERTT